MADCYQCEGHGEVCTVCCGSRESCECEGERYRDVPLVTCPACNGSGKEDEDA